MKRWQQSALLAVFGLVCVFNAWGQNEALANKSESVCERFQNNEWVKKHDQRIEKLVMLQTPSLASDIGSIFSNPNFNVMWKNDLQYHLDDSNSSLGNKIYSSYSNAVNKKYSDPKIARFMLAKLYAKHYLDMKKCASTLKSFIFHDLEVAIRHKVSMNSSSSSKFSKDSSNFSLESYNGFSDSEYIFNFNPKIPESLESRTKISDRIESALSKKRIFNTQLVSFIAATSNNSDAFIGTVQADVDKKFNEFFPTLEDWINQENNTAQRKKQEELTARDKAKKEDADYAASSDGKLDNAFKDFMTVEQCYKSREGYSTVYISQAEYQESKNRIKFIEERLKSTTKEAVDKKWTRLAKDFKFTARPNFLLSEQAIVFTCEGALSSLSATFNRINPVKGPVKSF